MRRVFLRSISALVALLLMHGTQAAIVTVPGADLEFTYDDATPFGTATVIGNTIFFTPTAFEAESLDGEGPVTMNETLNIDIEVTTPGYVMEDFLLVERGDYKLNGTGASVSANGELRITSLTTLAPDWQPFMDEDFFDAGLLTVNTNSPVAWSADASIDLANTAGWGTDTKVRMTIENLLTATTLNSGVGETAFIQKKFNGGAIGVIINPVPIPGAVWLFGSAIGLLAWMRRRKS